MFIFEVQLGLMYLWSILVDIFHGFFDSVSVFGFGGVHLG